MGRTSKFAVKVALELAAMKLEMIDRESRLIGQLIGSKDKGASESLKDLSINLDIGLGEIKELIDNALLISKDYEPEV